MADLNQGEHLPVLPLSTILERLGKMDHASTAELRELTFALAVHVANLDIKNRGLEARLVRKSTALDTLHRPGDQVTGG